MCANSCLVYLMLFCLKLYSIFTPGIFKENMTYLSIVSTLVEQSRMSSNPFLCYGSCLVFFLVEQ